MTKQSLIRLLGHPIKKPYLGHAEGVSQCQTSLHNDVAQQEVGVKFLQVCEIFPF